MHRPISMRARVRFGGTIALACVFALAAGCRGSHEAKKTESEARQAATAQKQETPGLDAESRVVQTREPNRDEARAATMAAGTTVVATLQSTVSTGSSRVGDQVALRTVEAVVEQGVVVVPAGSTIQGAVTHCKPAGRIKGGAELTLRFNQLVMPDGKSYPIACLPFRARGQGAGKESAVEIGGGAAAGALLGGVLGGKKDILSGAAIGAVAGTGVAAATRGHDVVLPAGQKLRVTLTSPVQVAPTPAS